MDGMSVSWKFHTVAPPFTQNFKVLCERRKSPLYPLCGLLTLSLLQLLAWAFFPIRTYLVLHDSGVGFVSLCYKWTFTQNH